MPEKLGGSSMYFPRPQVSPFSLFQKWLRLQTDIWRGKDSEVEVEQPLQTELTSGNHLGQSTSSRL